MLLPVVFALFAQVPAAPPDEPDEDASGYMLPPPTVPPRRPVATEPVAPLRERRKTFTASGELGWNGPVGVGVMLAVRPTESLVLEAGAGAAMSGLKVGGRARWNFMPESEWKPTLGAGVSWASGSRDQNWKLRATEFDDEVQFRVRESTFLQFITGAEYLSEAGFSLLFTVGYAVRLTPDPVLIVQGVVDPPERQAFDLAYASGLVLSMSFGLAF